jgi:hypothetical protein
MRIAFVAAMLLLSAYGGLVDGVGSLRSVSTVGQRLTASMQLAYGGLSVACLFALVAARGWMGRLLVVWAVALTLTAALASIFWGGTSIVIGVVAGLSVALVASLVLWAWRVQVRRAAQGAA